MDTEPDVQQGLAKMKVKYGNVAHTVVAYRLNKPIGPYRQGFNDDKEHGAGWRMLEEMKEQKEEHLAIYITCYSDGVKMGSRRFEIYRELAKKAIKKYRVKHTRLDRKNRLHRSQSQLSQLSADELQQEVESVDSQDEMEVPTGEQQRCEDENHT